MDVIDQAQNIAEFYNQMALLKRPEPKILATGFCLQCEEPIKPPRRWCDAGCRDDWERENK
jgi:hypothetical protein